MTKWSFHGEEGGELLLDSGMPSASEITRESWEEIPASPRTPMQHFSWVRAAFDTLYENNRAEFVAVSHDGGISAIAAFARTGGFPQRLMLAGAEEVGEPVDVLYEDAGAASALADKIIQKNKPVRFGHYPASSPFVSAFSEKAKNKGILLTAPIDGSPFITLIDSWKEPEAHFNSRRRSDFRRMTRKAEAFGALQFDIVTPSPNEVDSHLDAAIAVEAESWKSRSKTALADNDAQEAFFRRYCRLAAEEGILRICFMKAGDAIAAMQIAVECDNAFWLFKIGYDERFAACSPGNLLMLKTVRYAAERGLQRFEFLGKAAGWTKVWTETERPNIRMRYYPHSPEGYVALILDFMKVGAGRLSNLAEKMLSKGRKS